MDESDPFAVLNVPVDADEATIDRAWKTKLRIVHPDRHPDASPEIRERLEDRAQELNEAHDALVDPVRRADAIRARRDRDAARAPVPTPATPRPPRPTARRGAPPRPNGCERCGAEPTADYRFLQVRGVPFARFAPSEETTARLCRPCALAASRDHLNLALGKAWFVSFPVLASTQALWVNARAVRRARAAAVPTAPRAAAAHPGLPIPFRWGALLFGGTTLVIVGILAAWLVAPDTGPGEAPRVPGEILELRADRPSKYDNRADGTPGRRFYAFPPGDCVLGTSSVEPVSCDQPHDGLIVGSAYDVAQCPTGTDAIIRGQEIPVCIDLDG